MITMICRRDESEELTPQLLVNQHINEFDVTKFWVENGCWDGLYVSGAIFIDDHDYTGKRFSFNSELYYFKESPTEEMFDVSRNEHSNYISDGLYNAWFILFDELKSKGEIF